MSLSSADLSKLLDEALIRIAELEEENTQLREELGLHDKLGPLMKLIQRFRLTRTEARIVMAIYRRNGPVSHEMLAASYRRWGDDRDANAVKVHVSHMRHKTPFDLPTIVHGSFSLSDRDRELVRLAIQ